MKWELKCCGRWQHCSGEGACGPGGSFRISEDDGDAARDKERGKEGVADQEGTRKSNVSYVLFSFLPLPVYGNTVLFFLKGVTLQLSRHNKLFGKVTSFDKRS